MQKSPLDSRVDGKNRKRVSGVLCDRKMNVKIKGKKVDQTRWHRRHAILLYRSWTTMEISW